MNELPFYAKICGLTSADDARDIAVWSSNHGAVAIGLNFYAGSSRFVTPAQAREVVTAIRSVPGQDVIVVGVFVTQTHGEIESLVDAVGLDWVQLHGPYRPADLPPPRKPTIVAVPFGEASVVQHQIEGWERWGARAILLDAAHEGSFGGTGRSIDWRAASDVPTELPWILAGGLKPENLELAIRQAGATAVDVASGVESSPGKKDWRKVAEFLRIAREMLAK